MAPLSSMTPEQAAYTACAENISLLSILHLVPTLPKLNHVDNLPAFPKNYILPFHIERSLTGILAFLSSVKNDPDHIPAACIVEDDNSNCLNVFVAVNKRRSSDGKGLLDSLKTGFGNIFRLLENAVRHGSGDAENEVFTAIVSMCSSRILGRLRLVRRKNASKKSIKEPLIEAIDCAKRLTNQQNMRQIITIFVETAKKVVKSVDSWRKHQTIGRLEELIEAVHQLHRTKTFKEVLNALPDRDMDPTLRQSLVNTIEKVSRYRQAARFLLRAAKKFPIVRHMRMVPVGLPQGEIQTLVADNYKPELPATISRIAPKYAKKKTRNQIYRLLQANNTNANLDDQFAKQVLKTVQEAKVHAEVQLIIYCELQALRTFPRVISSSKDACHLCNAFINMQGKIHTPRCHGRLYPGWRLPFLPRLNGTQQAFNRSLEDQIRESLDTLLQRQQKTSYPCPKESTLLTLPTSISTLRSLPRSEMNTTGLLNRTLRDDNPPPHLINNSASRLIADTVHTDRATIPAVPGTVAEAKPSSDHLVRTSRSRISRHEQKDRPSPLSQVTASTEELDDGYYYRTSPLYVAGPLKLQIEYADSARQISSHSTDPVHSIEWLAAEDFLKEEQCHPNCVIDAESLEGEILHALCSKNSLCIAARGSVMRLRFRYN